MMSFATNYRETEKRIMEGLNAVSTLLSFDYEILSSNATRCEIMLHGIWYHCCLTIEEDEENGVVICNSKGWMFICGDNYHASDYAMVLLDLLSKFACSAKPHKIGGIDFGVNKIYEAVYLHREMAEDALEENWIANLGKDLETPVLSR